MYTFSRIKSLKINTVYSFANNKLLYSDAVLPLDATICYTCNCDSLPVLFQGTCDSTKL